MKTFIIFCEGPHDVYFLYRILKKMGFRSYEKKVKEMPSPLNKHFPLLMKEHKYEEHNLKDFQPMLPFMMFKEDQLLLLYAINGDSRDDKIKKTITTFIEFPLNEEDMGFTKGNNISEISFIFFYDADDKGIDSRIQSLKDKLSTFFSDSHKIEHGKYLISENHSNIGCYIFADPKTQQGKLEDITLPLMTIGNEGLFNDIKTFLEKYESMIPPDRKKHNQKATIGIAGQLQSPGASNTVILRYSDLITESKLDDSSDCNAIIKFFMTFLT